MSLKAYGAIPEIIPAYPEENVNFLASKVPQTMIDKCNGQCSSIACEVQETIVKLRTILSQNKNITMVWVNMPRGSKWFIEYVPRFRFWDFVTMVGCVFGFWFGLSMFGLVNSAL